MFKQTVDLTVHCTPQQAFDHVAKEYFINHPRWDPDIVELTQTSVGAVAVGSTGREVREVGGRRFTTTFRVSRYEPAAAFSVRTTEAAMGEDLDIVLQPQVAGTRVRLTVRIYPRTLPMRILAPFLRPRVERNFKANVGRFEELLNAAGTEPA